MNISVFPVGTIVKVTGARHAHFGKEGQVVGIDPYEPDCPLRIWFDSSSDHLLDLPDRLRIREAAPKSRFSPPTNEEQSTEPRTWNYPLHDLEKLEEWSFETLAEHHFPGQCHHYHKRKDRFRAQGQACDIAKCESCVTERILYNVWGAVTSADVCEVHAKQYGFICTDGLPLKRPVF